MTLSTPAEASFVEAELKRSIELRTLLFWE